MSNSHTQEGPLTGRYLITVRPDAEAGAVGALFHLASLPAFDSTLETPFSTLEAQNVFWFREVGVIVARLTEAQAGAIAAAITDTSLVAAIEPETTVEPLVAGATLKAHATQCRDYRWHLEETGAWGSKATGEGCRVILIDSGFDATHEAFIDRGVVSATLVSTSATADARDHGTGCLATAVGGPIPCGRGIAVASRPAMIKIQDASEQVPMRRLLAGALYGVAMGAEVISMSYGNKVGRPSAAWRAMGALAERNGSLLIAAGGNDGPSGVMGQPANTPGIVGVTGVILTAAGGVSPWPSSSRCGNGSEPDLAAPAESVWAPSSRFNRYRYASGTSIAAPHVAGIAALWWQRTGATGQALRAVLRANAKAITRSSACETGAGLVQAPG